MRCWSKTVCAGTAVLGLVSWAGAYPVTIVVDDTPRQDPLLLPEKVHELGWGVNSTQPGPFPLDEQINSNVFTTSLISCPQNYNGNGPPNYIVQITNLSGRAWTDLHFVADPDAQITNDDGLINSGLAFRIDNVGLNTPLLSESLIPNLVFEPGETWDFIVQNWYHPLGAMPHVYDSLGVGFQSAGFPPSAASIVAVPEPSLIGVIASALVALAIRRRR